MISEKQKKSILTPPVYSGSDSPTMSRVISHIYDSLDSLIDSINTANKGNPSTHVGKTGDMRVVEDRNSYNLQIRTAQGWSIFIDQNGNPLKTELVRKK